MMMIQFLLFLMTVLTKIYDFSGSSRPLHSFTNISTDQYCERIAYAFRKAHLSKKDRKVFLDLIREALPSPNYLPANMKRLLSLIQVNENLFEKRKICVLCSEVVSIDADLCSLCSDSNKAKLAFIYTSNTKVILSLLLNKYWDNIQLYKQQIHVNHDVLGTFDIGFGQSYKTLLHNFPAENFVTGYITFRWNFIVPI